MSKTTSKCNWSIAQIHLGLAAFYCLSMMCNDLVVICNFRSSGSKMIDFNTMVYTLLHYASKSILSLSASMNIFVAYTVSTSSEYINVCLWLFVYVCFYGMQYFVNLHSKYYSYLIILAPNMEV